MTSNLFLGTESEKGNRVFLTPSDRSTHVHIIGSTGTGKSKLMEHMIREDIIESRGLCLIDPHGYLYKDILRWYATKDLKRKIVLFDPAEDDWSFGFNPLRKSSKDLSHQVDSMVKACAKVWGADSLNQTPLLKRNLRNIFYVLAEKGLTLLESQYLFSPVQNEVREFLVRDCGDPIVKDQWDYYNQLDPKRFEEAFSSSINRLVEFLAAPRMRRIFGQLSKTIDFRLLMDEGYILLVNLSSGQRVSTENARMLGTLMVNEMFLCATERPPKSKPFYLYIDEFGLFVNEDIGRILDEGRKFGLHLILAHQHLSQLEEEDPKVYKSVLGDAKTKIVFGGLPAEDADIMAAEIFSGEIDFDEEKKAFRKRAVVDYVEETRTTIGRGYGTSRATGSNWNQMQSSISSHGISRSQNDLGMETTALLSGGGSGHASGSGKSESFGESESFSEIEAPFLRPKMGYNPGDVVSIPEHDRKKRDILKGLPQQHAVIRVPGQESMVIEVPTVSPGYARDERVARCISESYSLCGYIQPSDQAQREIEEREQRLVAAAKKKKRNRKEYPEDEGFRE